MKKVVAVVVWLMWCSTAWAAGTTHIPGNGLIFGNGTLFTGPSEPISGQAVCNIGGVLKGCSGGSGTMSGLINVTLPPYNAKGDGVTCDQTAIQNAINAAEAAATTGGNLTPVVYFPFPKASYLVGCNTPSVPLTITGSGVPAIYGIKLLGDSQHTSAIRANGATPVLFYEPANFYSSTLANNAFSTVSFGGGNVTAFNWDTTSASLRWINFKDMQIGLGGSTFFFNNATMMNGFTAMDFQAFVQFPSGLSTSTVYYITNSTGNDGITTNSAFDIHMSPGASTTTLSCTLAMSDGNHTVSAAIANATLNANTIHFVECNLSPGSGSGGTVNFFLDGTAVNTASSTTNGATIVQAADEQWLLGCIPSGVFNDSGNCNPGGSQSHWVGQIFGVRISSKAYNTSNYSAPTSLLAADGTNTQMLLNGTRTSDIWIEPEAANFLPGALPWHSGNLATGPTQSIVQGLELQFGSYGILNYQGLYLNLTDVYLHANGESGIHIENNAYGGTWRGLSFSTSGLAQSSFELIHNASLTSVDNVLMPGVPYYGEVMTNSDFVQSGGFLGINSNTLGGVVSYGETPGDSDIFNNLTYDVETGDNGPCYILSGVGNVAINGGSCATTGTIFPIKWNPVSGGSLTIQNVTFGPQGGPPTALLSKGSFAFSNPALFSQVSVNNTPLTGQSIPACTVPSACVVEPKVPITLTGATPTFTPYSGGDTEAETEVETLSANTTITSFASTSAPINGKVFHVILTQPSGSHNYTVTWPCTSGSCAWGSGVNLHYTTACSAMLNEPTGTGNFLGVDLIYNTAPSTPELDVLACQTGS